MLCFWDDRFGSGFLQRRVELGMADVLYPQFFSFFRKNGKVAVPRDRKVKRFPHPQLGLTFGSKPCL